MKLKHNIISVNSYMYLSNINKQLLILGVKEVSFKNISYTKKNKNKNISYTYQIWG